jgi:hypothetical protein
MGGSGGGGPFVDRTPNQLRNLIRKAEDKTAAVAFESELASTLGSLLGGYNARDAEHARQRLDEVKAALQDSIEGSFDQLFGGSVAKHTYVDGLSDIDSLVLINDSALTVAVRSRRWRRWRISLRASLVAKPKFLTGAWRFQLITTTAC